MRWCVSFVVVVVEYNRLFLCLQELFTWDHGNQLTYPIRYNDMTKYSSPNERAEEAFNAYVQTGYDNE